MQPEMSSHGTGWGGEREDLLSQGHGWEGMDGEASLEDHPSLSRECGMWAASQYSGDKGDPPGQDKPENQKRTLMVIPTEVASALNI